MFLQNPNANQHNNKDIQYADSPDSNYADYSYLIYTTNWINAHYIAEKNMSWIPKDIYPLYNIPQKFVLKKGTSSIHASNSLIIPVQKFSNSKFYTPIFYPELHLLMLEDRYPLLPHLFAYPEKYDTINGTILTLNDYSDLTITDKYEWASSNEKVAPSFAFIILVAREMYVPHPDFLNSQQSLYKYIGNPALLAKNIHNNQICLNILACTQWRLEKTKKYWGTGINNDINAYENYINAIDKQLSRQNQEKTCKSVNSLFLSILQESAKTKYPASDYSNTLHALLSLLHDNTAVQDASKKLNAFLERKNYIDT